MMPEELGAVTTPFHQRLRWDPANNLVRIDDLRIPEEWGDGHRPQTVDVYHDALYRVIDAEYRYHGDAGAIGTDSATDWRADHAASAAADPMRPDPAAMAPSLPTDRVMSMAWDYDWLGNMQDWSDDASSFYERSLGDIENGADRAAAERPGALHFASNVQKSAGTVNTAVDRGGWVELSYGDSGDVTSMLVHAQCTDTAVSCWDNASLEGAARAGHLRGSCLCASEQYYEYRWDELNRISEARRYDRLTGGAGPRRRGSGTGTTGPTSGR